MNTRFFKLFFRYIVIAVAACIIWFYIPDDEMKFNDKITASIALIALIIAWESAVSSKNSGDVAQKTLEDSQKSARFNNFEQRYNSLLALHNDLHKSVCTFLDTPDKVDGKGGVSEYGGKSYFKNIRTMKTLEDAHNTLMGHSVISPYMRILHHLLKHIFSYSANPEVFKKYSSPLRSLIRNDVLYLVALNTAVIYKNNSLEDNGYQEFQEYLHKSDFFEHTIFTADEYKNFNEVRNKLIFNFELSFNNPIKHHISNYVKTLEIQKDVIDLHKDLMLCAIFKNPFTPIVNSYVDNIALVIKKSYEYSLGETYKTGQRYLKNLEDLCAYYEKENKDKEFMLITDFSILREIALSNKDMYTLFFVTRSNGGADNCANVANWIVELDSSREVLRKHENNKFKIEKDLDEISEGFLNMFNGNVNKYKMNG
ncbi:hypothetical protein U3B84_004387 [Citrobacter freundii]|uniref:hypothetical protein n=1 Tax=Citrobacter freundii TaxID=546 RepID=UPI000764C7D9|nr:hypothetical protein [Citrobacter freundii]AYL74924.1 hypothetical protein CUC52_05165 [Citrobacter freundii]EGT3576540.1 hypothetical protein [Citrobacter freundii]EMA4455885.1 hypothetical protein [Citrobacter freundii]KWZ93258.1 hypothetical protein HMPREF3212_00340 [Citrobacter freundii]MCR3713939.1 hypothetical protein [Citrobacter freundii]